MVYPALMQQELLTAPVSLRQVQQPLPPQLLLQRRACQVLLDLPAVAEVVCM
jgi:hypothetical protein